MIKRFLLGCFCWVSFLVFAVVPVKAQDKSLSLAVKGGLAYGKLSADVSGVAGIDESYKAGVIGGISLVRQIMPNLSLESGLYYVTKKRENFCFC